jgi:hypothetical protein
MCAGQNSGTSATTIPSLTRWGTRHYLYQVVTQPMVIPIAPC